MYLTKHFEECSPRVIQTMIGVQGYRDKGFDVCDGQSRVIFVGVGHGMLQRKKNRGRETEDRGKGWAEHSTCGFFKWVDDIRELQYQNVDKNSIIMELEDKIELLKEKVRKLKAKQEKLVDQVEEMGMATTETLFEMKENNTDHVDLDIHLGHFSL
uniref:Uncharacterized protein n=1 Tax=Chenopodium quinoa TaxID=63459 RepID=A0A803KV08_CHEQI